MNKHTKGPWLVDKYSDDDTDIIENAILSIYNKLICSFTDRDRSEELTADAYLISAAPEMYEALKVAEQRLTQHYKDYLEMNSGELSSSDPFKQDIWMIRDAIAKAEGIK